MNPISLEIYDKARANIDKRHPDLAKYRLMSTGEAGFIAGALSLIPMTILAVVTGQSFNKEMTFIALAIGVIRWAYAEMNGKKVRKLDQAECDYLLSQEKAMSL